MNRTQLIVSLSGGRVRQVYSSDPRVEVLVVENDPSPAILDDLAGESAPCVIDVRVRSFDDLIGTEVAAAVEASQFAFA